jgi:hypothetical protein
MYSTPVDLSFSYLHSAVEASLKIKKDQVDLNTPLSREADPAASMLGLTPVGISPSNFSPSNHDDF